MSLNKNRYSKNHAQDWIIYCDLCAAPCWYSESTLLDVYTGRGGLLVCPRDADPIDYGLVPYTIPPEQGVTTTRINNFSNTTTSGFPAPFDYANNPGESGGIHEWQMINMNWEDININWEDLG